MVYNDEHDNMDVGGEIEQIGSMVDHGEAMEAESTGNYTKEELQKGGASGVVAHPDEGGDNGGDLDDSNGDNGEGDNGGDGVGDLGDSLN